VDKKYQEEMTKTRLESQTEVENKILQIRNHYENSFLEIKNNLKNQIEQEYIKKIEQLKQWKAAVEQDREAIAKENEQLNKEKNSLSEQIQRHSVESALRIKEIEEENKIIRNKIDNLMLEKSEHEKCIKDLENERNHMTMESEKLEKAIRNASSLNVEKEDIINKLKKDLKLEAENRSRFESELVFLKQKIQQMEYQIGDLNDQLTAQMDKSVDSEKRFNEKTQKKEAVIGELKQELDAYKDMEKTFISRMKWAIKGQGISGKDKGTGIPL
jgi:DNA repair exonuclease SbcCD ATPase subunit